MDDTPKPTNNIRANPAPHRNRMMRKAGDLTDGESLAAALGIKPRTIYALMKGDRRVNEGQLRDARDFLIERRQQIGMLLHLIRDELTEDER